MWYRTVIAQSLLEQQLSPFDIQKEKMYPELEQLLLKMGKTTDEYFAMNKEQQREIWEMLVTRSDTNLYNEFEDEDLLPVRDDFADTMMQGSQVFFRNNQTPTINT